MAENNGQIAVTIIAMRCRACGITQNTPDFLAGQDFWNLHSGHGPILFIRAISEELDLSDQETFDKQMEAVFARRLG